MAVINGYKVGRTPSASEFNAYRAVEVYYYRLYVAERLEGKNLTDQEYEMIVDKFSELRENSGEEEWDNFNLAYDMVIG